jgi:hypothetical protein
VTQEDVGSVYQAFINVFLMGNDYDTDNGMGMKERVKFGLVSLQQQTSPKGAQVQNRNSKLYKHLRDNISSYFSTAAIQSSSVGQICGYLNRDTKMQPRVKSAHHIYLPYLLYKGWYFGEK